MNWARLFGRWPLCARLRLRRRDTRAVLKLGRILIRRIAQTFDYRTVVPGYRACGSAYAEGMQNAALTVAHNVTRLRKARGWLQRDLSERLEPFGYRWSLATVSAAEKGRRAWTANELVALAEAFGVGIAELFESPSHCANCKGTPPVGFICQSCRARGDVA